MTGFRGWAAHHPVRAFLVLLFGVGYPLMSLPILAHHGVIPGASLPARLGLDTEKVTVLLMMFGVMVPSALWVTWAADGTEGVRRLFGRVLQWRVGVVWWVVILGGLPATSIVFALLLGDSLRPLTLDSAWDEVVGLLIGFLLINLWEETAWAGFVQTRLERGHSIWVAAALTGVPFALIHMPLQFIGAFSLDSVLSGFIALMILAPVFRLLLATTLRGTRDSVFAVGLLHTMFNRSNNSDGIVARVIEGEARMVGALLATLVLTIILAIVLRHRLGRDYRTQLGARAAG